MNRQIAYVMAQVLVGYARIEGMKALNAERDRRGEAPGYTEEHFEQVVTDLGLHHNAVIDTLNAEG